MEVFKRKEGRRFKNVLWHCGFKTLELIGGTDSFNTGRVSSEESCSLAERL
jgi:hypothetical protein